MRRHAVELIAERTPPHELDDQVLVPYADATAGGVGELPHVPECSPRLCESKMRHGRSLRPLRDGPTSDFDRRSEHHEEAGPTACSRAESRTTVNERKHSSPDRPAKPVVEGT